ncbi:hypothetical protein [Azospirillum sp.]|uniref:hypothetical protein n=1 Tax=Azospirillum sp. TaxID=34012 RepID=UPI002D353DD2|nr:hypothetical protein [Azospirillum sp.]HYD69722.1 hypothetical protein [Azospirillum sp.]
MPAPKMLAAIAATLTAALLSSPSAAQAASFQLCFTNKAWVVWDYTLVISHDAYSHTDQQTGQEHFITKEEHKRWQLTLGENACYTIHDFQRNARFVVDSNFGGVLNIGVRNTSTTVRLDGTVFNARMTVLDGVRLD